MGVDYIMTESVASPGAYRKAAASIDRRHLSSNSRGQSAYKSVRSVRTLKQSIITYKAYTKSLAGTKRSDSLYSRTKKYQSSLTSSKRARPLTRTDLKLLEHKDQPVK